MTKVSNGGGKLTFPISGGILVAVAISVSLVSSASAAGAPCADVPVRVTILNTAVDPITGDVTPTALRGDASGEYVHGGSKVSATIRLCDGTHDVILNVSSTKRTFAYQFPVRLRVQ